MRLVGRAHVKRPRPRGLAAGRYRAGQVEKGLGPVQFAGPEQGDCSVFAVIPGLAPYLAAAQPAYCLRQEAAAGPAQIIGAYPGENAELGSESRNEPVHLGADLLALRPGGHDFPDYLRQLHQVGKSRGSGRPVADGAVGQFGNPVQHADRERLGALRAGSFVFPALRGLKADPAFPVTV